MADCNDANEENNVEEPATATTAAEDDGDVQEPTLSTVNKSKFAKKARQQEVLYRDGATALFLAVEDCRWRDALDIAESHPNQIKIWVDSTGSGDSTYDWSTWKRLPIHEACRRQAPAWLISTLLSEFAESAQEISQFDQLPLHIAVEFGAAPEVVNLLVVAYWDAIVAEDQSGRTPMDLLNTSELLQQEDHRVVFESLSRCHSAYTNFQKAALDAQNAIKRKHKTTFAAVSKKHSEELKRERSVQDDLKAQIQALEDTIIGLKDDVKARDVAVENLVIERRGFKLNEQRLGEHIAGLDQDVANEKHAVKTLLATVDQKDGEIKRRDDRVEMLSGDLQAVLLMQEQDMAASLEETERSMRAMVSHQIALQKQIASQAHSLRALLSDRGIQALVPTADDGDEFQEEKESSFNVEVDAKTEAAVVAAAVAALSK